MGNKRKRQEEDEERISKKIKRLEKKLRQKRRRILLSDDTDTEDEGQVLPELSSSYSPHGGPPQDRLELNLDMPSLISPLPETSPDHGLSVVPGPRTQGDIINQEEEMQLENEILTILGDAPQPDVAMGPNLHKDIASRWQDTLSKGLSKEIRDALFKKYLIPSNCSLLVAPVLNPEVKAAVSEIAVKRDSSLLQKQSHIGIALAALSQLTEMIIRNESSKQTLLQPLSDACRLLCNSHYFETKTRRSIIMSSLNTCLRDTLFHTKRDNYLFGEELGEKLRAAKSVQRTGESLSKPNQIASSSQKPTYKTNTQQFRALNYRAMPQRKPPYRSNEASRGRGTARQTHGRNQRQPARPPKAPSPSRRNYRR